MKKTLVFLFATILINIFLNAEDIYVYEVVEGQRYDLFNDEKPKKEKEGFGGKTTFSFFINDKVSRLKVSSSTFGDSFYDCITVNSTSEIIQLMPKLSTKLKTEFYTLYPNKKYAFLQISSAFIGMEQLKSDPTIPYGSACIFVFKKIN